MQGKKERLRSLLYDVKYKSDQLKRLNINSLNYPVLSPTGNPNEPTIISINCINKASLDQIVMEQNRTIDELVEIIDVLLAGLLD